MRPSPVRTRARKSSVAGRPVPKSRKSMSAPPDTSLSSPTKDRGKQRERFSSVKPPESNFEPDLPPAALQRRQLSVVRDTQEEEEPASPVAPEEIVPPQAVDDVTSDPDEGVHVEEEEQLDENVHAVAQRIAEGPVAKPEAEEVTDDRSRPIWRLVLMALFIFTSLGAVFNLKQESSQIGFCNTGTNTNAILEAMRSRRAAVESCNRENRTTLYGGSEANHTVSPHSPLPIATPISADAHDSDVTPEPCPPPPLLPYAPNECTPCPKHAICTPSSITCDTGFILRPHPLLAFLRVPAERVDSTTGILQKYERTSPALSDTNISRLIYSTISSVLDGLPYLGSVAVPPYCAEDPHRKRNIGALGKGIIRFLAVERGRRLCAGVNVGLPEGDQAVEAQRWGVELEKLKEHAKERTSV